jgi:hypothetical protein
VTRIFGPKREEVSVDWRRLRNEELQYLYASLIIVRVVKSRDEMGGECNTHGSGDRCITIFVVVGKRERKRPLGRLTYRSEDNIRMCLGK